MQEILLFLSEAAIEVIKHITPNDITSDFMLLEYEQATQLRREKRLNILPILIGHRTTTPLKVSFDKFNWAEFGGHLFPGTRSKTSSREICPKHHDRNVQLPIAFDRIFCPGYE